MSGFKGYIGFDALGDIIVDSYQSVILFKTPEDARSMGAYRVAKVIQARMPRKKKAKPEVKP